MVFEDLSKKSVKEQEKSISEYWKSIDLLQRSVESRPEDNRYVFYDGPPTANGAPGIHHVISRTLKDLTCRYKTMKGYRVERQAGWDTHGLPVEIEVEKKLGLESKQEIEDYGIEKFNQECRDSVFTYKEDWEELSDRMAFLADMENPYITLDNDYIETVWWLLDQMNKKGLIYEGQKILPYCGRCGTGLASHEVAQGYKDVKTDSVYVKFKAEDEDAYFLAWTTTPWTLPSNVALSVHPEVDYVKVKVAGDSLYLAEALLDQALNTEDYEILEKLKGQDLIGRSYEQILPFLDKGDKEAFYIVGADYVTTSDGTGIVHTAPAFGEEDNETGRAHDLPVFNPVDDDAKFMDTPWKGMFVMDADPEIIEYLWDNGLLYRRQKIEHSYPHCWRCDTELIYYAKPSWYIEVTKLKDVLISENNKVNWYPDYVGEKRFGNWLENLKDWAINRARYWGTPFPIWRCEECNEFISIGSRKELKEKAIEDISENIELHRPFVDEVHIECECGGTMSRVEDVIDVWFDSGAMPFASLHYPFENQNVFEDYFPADFINEGIDQTRGWFYSLMAISVLITGKAAYKNVLVNDLVLDSEGKKMSKSRGNTLDPIELFDQYGADVVRYYSIAVSPPWIPTRFDVNGLREADSKFFRTLKSTYNFFQLYANTDEIDPKTYDLEIGSLAVIDKWLLSKYNRLLKEYHENMDIFEYTKAIRSVNDFLIEDLSNWYIRRNRRRFWSTEMNEDKKAVYKTTCEVLLGIIKMMAPFTPFITENIYQKLVGGESIHLELLPEADESMIDEKLEKEMETVRSLVSLGRASRESAQIKVRQPLGKILVEAKLEDLIGNYDDLIKEELNVKEVVYSDDIAQYMDYEIKPNYKEAGSVLGGDVQAFAKYLASSSPKEVLDLAQEGKLLVELPGGERNIPENFLDVRISAKEGFDVENEAGLYIILDTELNEDLLSEGYAREFISHVQNMRKDAEFEVTDHINILYSGDDEIEKAIEEHKDQIASEVLAKNFEKSQIEADDTDLNGKLVKIQIQRV